MLGYLGVSRYGIVVSLGLWTQKWSKNFSGHQLLVGSKSWPWFFRSRHSLVSNTPFENERRLEPKGTWRFAFRWCSGFANGLFLGEAAIFQGVHPPSTGGRKNLNFGSTCVWFGWFRWFWTGKFLQITKFAGKRIGKSIRPNTHMKGSTSYKGGLWGPYKWVNLGFSYLVTMANGPWMKMLCVFSYLKFFRSFSSNSPCHQSPASPLLRGISWKH